MITCIQCELSKEESEFGNDASRPSGKFPYCKSCVSASRNTYKERERNRLYEKARRDADPDLRANRVDQERARRYKRLYGITVDEYDKMFEFQDGSCAICGRPPKNKRLAVDHDHKTGAVRGLLCHICNQTLHNKITKEWLFEAYEYLNLPPVGSALGRIPIGKRGAIKKRRSKKKNKS